MTKKKEKQDTGEKKKPKQRKKPSPKAAKTPKTAEAPQEPVVDDRFLRLQADFENFRKRTLREKEELYHRANTELMEELLSVLDHQDLAFSSLTDEVKADPVVQGFKLVSDQLVTALGKFGLTPIDAEGQDFDPNVHEAVSHLPSADVKENCVIVQTRRGYMLANRLLRAAQVVVSSGAPDEPNEK